jgi:hypothetical protein
MSLRVSTPVTREKIGVTLEKDLPSRVSLPKVGGLGVRVDGIGAESPIPQSRKGETRRRRSLFSINYNGVILSRYIGSGSKVFVARATNKGQ